MLKILSSEINQAKSGLFWKLFINEPGFWLYNYRPPYELWRNAGVAVKTQNTHRHTGQTALSDVFAFGPRACYTVCGFRTFQTPSQGLFLLLFYVDDVIFSPLQPYNYRSPYDVMQAWQQEHRTYTDTQARDLIHVQSQHWNRRHKPADYCTKLVFLQFSQIIMEGGDGLWLCLGKKRWSSRRFWNKSWRKNT
jgi:hypothetical protein